MAAELNINSIRNILLALEENWFNSNDEVAIHCAHLLKSALSEESAEVPHLPKCAPPSGLCLGGQDHTDMGLFQTLFQCWAGLGWTIAPQFKLPELDERIKEARLIGPYGPIKSNNIDVKISYVSPNTLVPRHSEEAAEMLQILEGDQIQIGLAVDDWLERKKYNYFPPTHPKVVKTSENHFVAISVHYGKIDGKWWLNDEDKEVGVHYLGIAEVDKKGVEKYFDNVAKDYERAMRTWGYCMPQLLTQAIIEEGQLAPSGNVKIIDLGCGDGAVGAVMHSKGFTNLTGTDISDGMMKIAESKGIYKELKKADLLQDLPFAKESFDCAVTSAVTTYLDSSALKFWLPIVKPGGIFGIVHKASVWPKWVDEQERLENSKVWKLLWYTQEPVPYLPSLEGKGTDRARIYIYQKL